MDEGILVPMQIVENRTINFKQLGGAYHITLTNQGSTPIRIMNTQVIQPDEVFSVDVDFSIVNNNFRVEFLTNGIANPVNYGMLWYGQKHT